LQASWIVDEVSVIFPGSQRAGECFWRGHNLFPLILRVIGGHSEAIWRIGVLRERYAWPVDRAGEDYYIEDVPYVMYFHEGYGLHGVTWHGNFGHPMSHGCVNLPTSEAE